MTGRAQLNVNQFALPGMEEHAHAGAPHLAEGVMFEYSRPPLSTGRFGPKYEGTEHRLAAHDPAEHEADVSSLTWTESTGSVGHFPGEIRMVSTDASYGGKGLASSLFKMAHDPDVYTGEDTVPVHSWNRTEEGLAWGRKVGGPDPVPLDVSLEEYENNDDALPSKKAAQRWHDREVRHLHPAFQGEERQDPNPWKAQREFERKRGGQLPLPGMAHLSPRFKHSGLDDR